MCVFFKRKNDFQGRQHFVFCENTSLNVSNSDMLNYRKLRNFGTIVLKCKYLMSENMYFHLNMTSFSTGSSVLLFYNQNPMILN